MLLAVKEPMVQCKLEKQEGSSTLSRVTWADADKAVVGRTVKVEEVNGEWTTGWEVKEVYGPPLPRSVVQHNSHAHTRQRKASDI